MQLVLGMKVAKECGPELVTLSVTLWLRKSLARGVIAVEHAPLKRNSASLRGPRIDVTRDLVRLQTRVGLFSVGARPVPAVFRICTS